MRIEGGIHGLAGLPSCGRIKGTLGSAAVCADIPHFYVRKSGMPNIIGVLAGLVSHGG
jgi:hypothetical protein